MGWGKKSKDWALVQEANGNSGYEHVFEFLKPTATAKILDVGCCSGFFSNLAHLKGLNVSGLDSSAALIEQAKNRNPSINFLAG